MNKYILPSILTVFILVIAIVSIFFILKNSKSENFDVDFSSNTSNYLPDDIVHNGVNYRSVNYPSYPDELKDADVIPEDASFLMTEASGNINTLDIKYLSKTISYLSNKISVNRQRADILANFVSEKLKGIDTQSLNELKTLVETLKADVDNLKNTTINKTKDIKIVKSVGGTWFPDKTLFTDDAGPLTTVAAFGKIQDHPDDNKFRIFQ